MANKEHLAILKQGVEVWNEWRRENREIRPDLIDANLSGADLSDANLSDGDLNDADLRGANLNDADLSRADLSRADLSRADLIGADLSGVKLKGADLSGADFSRANLSDAYFNGANLSRANLSDANLSGANLCETNISSTRLQGADFTIALLDMTVFADTDLSEVKELDSVLHRGPSTIGIDTLYKAAGNIPEVFLRGCGVPDDFITFIPSHFGIQQAIQFYSCFISYSSKDEEFARRLYSKMRDEHLRVWFAPEDIKGGQKTIEQLERAIQMYDRLLLVLSEQSMKSEWVQTEIYKARQIEITENRRKLFPIRLVDFETIKTWKCFDADTGRDLAREVREYHIPDFSKWKEHDPFEKAFAKLCSDLKAEEGK